MHSNNCPISWHNYYFLTITVSVVRQVLDTGLPIVFFLVLRVLTKELCTACMSRSRKGKLLKFMLIILNLKVLCFIKSNGYFGHKWKKLELAIWSCSTGIFLNEKYSKILDWFYANCIYFAFFNILQG